MCGIAGIFSLDGHPVRDGRGEGVAEASSLPLVCCAMLFGTLALSPFIPSGMGSHIAALGALDWVYLIFVALLSTFTGYLIWGLAIRRMEARQQETVSRETCVQKVREILEA